MSPTWPTPRGGSARVTPVRGWRDLSLSERRARTLAQDCPTCSATPGESCVAAASGIPTTVHHQPRQQAAITAWRNGR